MPLIINSLRGRHTHITHMYTDVCTETILRNKACTDNKKLMYQCFLKSFSKLTKNIICINTGVVILMYNFAMHVMCNTLSFMTIIFSFFHFIFSLFFTTIG